MTKPRSATRLLIRTTELDDRVLAFADELAAASGYAVAFVVDERKGPVPARGRETLGLTRAGCRALGLFCPADFTWKCGDYGYYLARLRYPDASLFWLIEYDVRFVGPDLPSFFARFDALDDVDLLATDLRPSDNGWYWTDTVRGRGVTPYRCLFPVTRLSVRAVDAALAKRVEQSRRPLRRLLWPNDEAHVATALANGGFMCRDFNDFGRPLYTPETFSFHTPIDGDRLAPVDDTLRMHHPVLFGEAFQRKVKRLGEKPPSQRVRDKARRLGGKIAQFTAY